VLETQSLARPAESERPVAGAVVGHHALDLDTEACVISDRGLEEGYRSSLLLVVHDVGEGDAGMIVDTNVHVFPADATAVALAAAVAGDAI
jgi:hypothetical protein